ERAKLFCQVFLRLPNSNAEQNPVSTLSPTQKFDKKNSSSTPSKQEITSTTKQELEPFVVLVRKIGNALNKVEKLEVLSNETTDTMTMLRSLTQPFKVKFQLHPSQNSKESFGGLFGSNNNVVLVEPLSSLNSLLTFIENKSRQPGN